MCADIYTDVYNTCAQTSITRVLQHERFCVGPVFLLHLSGVIIQSDKPNSIWGTEKSDQTVF
jgi:hypothetical protein